MSDYRLTTGFEGLRLSFLRAMGVEPGGILWRPDYGIGIGSFLNKPGNAANLFEMKTRIINTLSSHPAVREVKQPIVTVDSPGQVGLIQIRVEIIMDDGHVEQLAVAVRNE